MRFGVLGPLEVRAEDGTPVPVHDTKVRSLLVLLLLARGRVVPTDRLIHDLWGEDPPARPRAVLQARVSQLRGALERAEAGSRALVRHRPPGYLLDTVELDLARFEDLIDRAGDTADPRGRVDLLTRALDLWRGSAAAGFTDLEPVREAAAHLEERRLTALEDLAEARLDLGAHVELADALAPPAREHPYRERLHAALIRALYAAGRQGEALRHYDLLRTRLADDLGVDPGPELVALHHAILVHDDGLIPAPPAGNLPAAVVDLVGRDTEAAALRDLLDRHRLVTVTGPGGVGKTSLALAVARAVAAGDPARPVDLAALDSEGDPVTALATALGVRDGDGPLTGRIGALLRGRRALLVLDNCEHLVEGVADLAARLLAGVSDLRILATSQVPLSVAGEYLYPLAPLDVPVDDTPRALAASGAARLFLARAEAAGARPGTDPDTVAAIAELCRRLDGIPLALELAATRLRHLRATDLAARLDDRFALLGGGRRDAPARQRTLRAAIDWSWEPLTGPERALLSRLAVFADGCDPAAVDTVCGGSPELVGALVDRSLVVTTTHAEGTRYRLPESVAAYALEHLSESEEEGTRARHAAHFAAVAEDADGRLRGPGQARALALLDRENANLRAASAFAARSGDARTALRLVVALTWYRFLRGRAGEARAALDTALALPDTPAGTTGRSAAPAGAVTSQVPGMSADPGAAGAIGSVEGTGTTGAIGSVEGTGTTGAIGSVVPAGSVEAAGAAVLGAPAGTGGPPGESRARATVLRAALAVHATDDERWRDDVHDHLRRIGDPVARARLAWFAEFTRWALGDPAVATARVAAAHETAREAGDRWGAALSQVTLALAAFGRGDLSEASAAGREAEALLRDLGDPWGLLQASDVLARIAEARGDLDDAARRHEEGLRIAQDLRLDLVVSRHLAGLGRVALLTGDLDRADALHERALRSAEEQDDAVARQFADAGIALIARRRGDLDRAERSLTRWLEWNHRTDGHVGAAFILAQLGYIAEQRGEPERALELHARGRERARLSGDPRAIALALEGEAGARSLAGEHTAAAELLARAAGLRESAGAPLTEVERWDVDRALARVLP
ncbi:BTAD domain-containing putative transcriptional regulator [Nocardiopsis sp. N85]|uniref:BTAD domain-containing putative transcriptional regulator n=1 Tax=Nocardiopsis sp. N85 TaxID=3029400 RepID=UPI00237F2FC3|nr:BTAD domain-containing putative transcriptional regulator [Nocardiopsis sp. N85]MDE3724178.1 BTAD domain-containing putative transcriptional regulator [Nocardiopsis sp. N85]